MPQGTSQGGAMGNLMNRMPNTQQINPVVTMQAELIKAGILSKNDLSPKALLDYVTEVMKDDTKRAELKARAEATNNAGLIKLYDTVIRAQSTLERGKEHDKSQEKIGAGHDAARRYAADASERASEKRVDARFGDGTFKNLKIASEMYDKDVKSLENQLTTALKQSQGKDTDETKRIRQEITQKQSLKKNIETMTNKVLETPPSTGVDELEQQDQNNEDEMMKGDFVFPSGK